MNCTWIVTSRALVGSSAINSLRTARDGHGGHDPLAHAAAELVRDSRAPVPGPTARARDPSSSTAMPRAADASAKPWARIGAATWAPTVNTGLSDVIGSWEIMAICRPRTSSTSTSSSKPTSSRPSSFTEPCTIRPAGLGGSPRSDRPVMVLPLPDSPIRPRVSRVAKSKLTPSTAFKTPRFRNRWVLRSRTFSRRDRGSASLSGSVSLAVSRPCFVLPRSAARRSLVALKVAA